VSPTTTRRARSVAAKQRREHEILQAARTLAFTRTVRAVTLTDIATEVGLHKSAMLRYFETREQIFLAITAQSWVEWSAAFRSELGTASTPAAAARILSRSLVTRPLFCDLLAQAPMNLERNVSLEAVYDFKVDVLAEVELVAGALGRALGLTGMQSRNVIAAATSLAGALWQMAAPGTELSALYLRHPELTHARVDVEPRLRAILAALITGMTLAGRR
jgi:AcrR family transcriptional regulator